MPEQPRQLANKYEDIVNLQGRGHVVPASPTACLNEFCGISALGGVLLSLILCTRTIHVCGFSGAGRRSCLGELLARQEMFLFIAGLAQSFDIVPPEGHDSIDVTDVLGITLAPEPFSVRLIPRR